MTLLIRLIALLVLTLLPMVAIDIHNHSEAQAMRAQEGKEEALRLVRLVAQDDSRLIEGARQLMTAISRSPTLQTGERAVCSGFLAALVKAYPQYLSLVATDPDGHPLCTGGLASPDAVLSGHAYFRQAIAQQGLVLGEYEVDRQTRQRAIYLAQPYDLTDGKIGGVVAAGLSLDWLNDELAHAPLPPKATVSVIDRQGTVIARFPNREQFVGTQISSKSHSYLLSGGEGVQEAVGFDGISRIYSYAPLPTGPSGLTLSVGLDKEDLFSQSQAANRRDLMVIAGSSVLALMLAALGARLFISRPIRLLLQTAEQWRQGNLEVRAPFADLTSEFGRLGAAFNTMAAAIGSREQDLERRVQERTQALEAAMQAQQQAEAALHEVRKMEAVGRLTGGVAHDFNNLLAAIVGNIELASLRLGQRHPQLPRLDAAMRSAQRGAVLIQHLLAFARRQHLRPEVIDLNRYFRTMQEMLRARLRSDIAIDMDLAGDVGFVRVDPNQFEVAILHLAMNAADAMSNGGTLRLQTRNANLVRLPGQTEMSGDFVAVTLTDTGQGIPAEILDHVFDPFFTTKSVGSGSGLGLSMVQGFVRQSAGFVYLESQPGRGTSVTIYLPRQVDIPVTAPSSTGPAAELQGTILLVDDDETFRSVTAQLLEMIGYSVMTAQDADQALECFQRADGKVDILVTDLVLPDGPDGIALTASIHSQQPTLPVLLITGHGDAVLDRIKTTGFLVLKKPFERADLVSAVQQARQHTQNQSDGATMSAPWSC